MSHTLRHHSPCPACGDRDGCHRAAAFTRSKIVLEQVSRELFRAMQLHEPQNSYHEGYGGLMEEVDEFWDEVKKKSKDRDPVRIREELTQIAAMAVRTIVDCAPVERS